MNFIHHLDRSIGTEHVVAKGPDFRVYLDKSIANASVVGVRIDALGTPLMSIGDGPEIEPKDTDAVARAIAQGEE